MHRNTGRPATALLAILALSVLVLSLTSLGRAQTLTVETAHAVNHFNPERDLGTTINRLTIPNTVARVMIKPMLEHMAGKGFKPVSYRVGTELHAEAWHWNPSGAWSDAAHHQGYFVGDAKPGQAIEESWGYRLPRGAASLVDGSLFSFWKSNPYLDQYYTHAPNATLPQWVIVDLGKVEPVSAVRIAWGAPYATHYAIQYWTGGDSNPHAAPTQGVWEAFEGGVVRQSKGGTVTLQFSPAPVRYLRVLMSESSDACGGQVSHDRRDCLGYSIRELYAGSVGANGAFTDLIRHGVAGPRRTGGLAPRPSRAYASSVDPWHQASDLHEQGGLQYGLDAFFHGGMTAGAPALIPVALLYSNPETAAHQVAYLEARGYPVSRFEMGEKPDSQWVQPEDYAALYIQFADAIHKVAPNAPLGGPSLGPHIEDFQTWPDAQGRTSWMARFVGYLKEHGHLHDLAFVSFAYFPLPCNPDWNTLYGQPTVLRHFLATFHADGVPADVPLVATEANVSPGAGEAFETMFGALWQADYLASFLDAGGAATYYFHGIPEPFYGRCGPGGGIFGSVNVDENFQFKDYLSQYFANRLVSMQWAQPVNAVQAVYRVRLNEADPLHDAAGGGLITAYAVHRPDGQWAILAINKDENEPHSVRVGFERTGNDPPAGFAGTVTTVTFGKAQYEWHPVAVGVGGIANPDGPPVTAMIAAGPNTRFTLPAASITVIRGAVSSEQ